MQPIFNSYVQLPEGTWSTFDQPWLTTIPRRFGRARPKVGPDVCISLTSWSPASLGRKEISLWWIYL
jgi:hypothetical protein